MLKDGKNEKDEKMVTVKISFNGLSKQTIQILMKQFIQFQDSICEKIEEFKAGQVESDIDQTPDASLSPPLSAYHDDSKMYTFHFVVSMA